MGKSTYLLYLLDLRITARKEKQETYRLILHYNLGKVNTKMIQGVFNARGWINQIIYEESRLFEPTGLEAKYCRSRTPSHSSTGR